MKLNELLTKPLNEVLVSTDITSMKPISDEKGNLIKIIIEYEPKGGAR